MHRPDSPVVAGSAGFIDFLERTRILEVLALASKYVGNRNENLEKELVRRGERLRDMTVAPEFDAYFRATLKGIVDALEAPEQASADARKLIGRFETELRWRLQRDRFLASHMATIPTDRGKLATWLESFGFEIKAIEELRQQYSGRDAVVGWGVRLIHADT
jgi:hypothetical protein